MTEWKNLDLLKSYQALAETKDSVDLKQALAGEAGAKRVARYCVPMAEGLAYNYAAKKVDDTVLEKLAALAEEAQLEGTVEDAAAVEEASEAPAEEESAENAKPAEADKEQKPEKPRRPLGGRKRA